MSPIQKIEIWLPRIMFVLTFAGFFWYGPGWVSKAQGASINLENFYTSIFGVATVLTGFLATFYGIIATSPTRFMQRLKRTHAFAKCKKLIKNAMGYGFALTLVSIPFIIFAPLPTDRLTGGNFTFSAYSAYTLWTLTAFYRAASSFFVMVEEPEEQLPPGG